MKAATATHIPVVSTSPRKGPAKKNPRAALHATVVAEQSTVSFGFHPWPNGDLEPLQRTVTYRNLGDKPVMILRNHGLLTVGASIAEAFNGMFRLERACQVQVAALSCNTELSVPSAEVVEASWRLYQPGVRRRLWGRGGRA